MFFNSKDFKEHFPEIDESALKAITDAANDIAIKKGIRVYGNLTRNLDVLNFSSKNKIGDRHVSILAPPMLMGYGDDSVEISGESHPCYTDPDWDYKTQRIKSLKTENKALNEALKIKKDFKLW